MMNQVNDVLHEILYPSDYLVGSILSAFFTFLILLIFWKTYEKQYSFTVKEKTVAILLSCLFMFTGTVLIQGPIPIVVWGILTFQFMVDRKYMELTDGGNLWILIFAINPVIIHWMNGGFVQSGILTGVVLFIFFFLLALVGPMGGGDIKMMGAIGLYFTLWDIPTLLLYGFLIGAIQGIFLILLCKKEKKAEYAFGPALIIGVWAFIWCSGGGI